MSSLIGASPKAYDLWLTRRAESRISSELKTQQPLPVLVVVDCRSGTQGLVETLGSIEGTGWSVILLGLRPGDHEGIVIRHPEELSGLLPESEPTWILPIYAGDLLPEEAASAYASAAVPGARILYADDDLISEDGRRTRPHFKPNWNAELYRFHDYLSGSCMLAVDRSLLTDIPEEGWEKTIIERLLRAGEWPIHVPEVLHHRRRRPMPRVPAAPVEIGDETLPTVSVIIPTRNKADLLKACLDGLERTSYPEIEVIIADNGSDSPDALALMEEHERRGARVLRAPGPFNFSALNNQAARLATGRLLCLLNNDVEVIDPEWLKIMALQAVRPEIGAVGARLLYADGTVQHAGVVLGIGGGAGHAHRLEPAEAPRYFERSRLPQFVSAVTAACLVVERAKYEFVGGFDEEQFAVAFNDVDLCLRLDAAGFQSLYEPRATLIHHESKSRGKDRTGAKKARFERELAALKERWNTDQRRDPYHHPALSPFSEAFVLDLR